MKIVLKFMEYLFFDIAVEIAVNTGQLSHKWNEHLRQQTCVSTDEYHEYFGWNMGNDEALIYREINEYKKMKATVEKLRQFAKQSTQWKQWESSNNLALLLENTRI